MGTSYPADDEAQYLLSEDSPPAALSLVATADAGVTPNLECIGNAIHFCQSLSLSSIPSGHDHAELCIRGC